MTRLVKIQNFHSGKSSAVIDRRGIILIRIIQVQVTNLVLANQVLQTIEAREKTLFNTIQPQSTQKKIKQYKRKEHILIKELERDLDISEKGS